MGEKSAVAAHSPLCPLPLTVPHSVLSNYPDWKGVMEQRWGLDIVLVNISGTH